MKSIAAWRLVTLSACALALPASSEAQATLFRMSGTQSGEQGNNHSLATDISGDSRFIVFSSTASNLVPGDTNGASDVFRVNRLSRQVDRVSIGPAGVGGGFGRPRISADGRYVAFMSGASDLVPSDTNGATDIFVRDMTTGQITRVSVSSTGGEASAPVTPRGWLNYEPDISDDGRYIAFGSYASNLVANDTNNACDVNGDQVATDSCPDVFVHDRTTGETRLVSRDPTGVQLTAASLGTPAISGDGRLTTYLYSRFLFVHDRTTNQVTDQCNSPDGLLSACVAENASFSSDGRYLAFPSQWADLTGNAQLTNQIAVKDLQTGSVTRLTLAHGQLGVGTFTSNPQISGDGRWIVFDSNAANLTPGDTNGRSDVFAVSRVSGAILLLSQFAGPGDGNSGAPAISHDGRHVVFGSLATNLAQDDTNGVGDVFAYTAGDSDEDTLLDVWEEVFGLSPTSASGDDGPDGDPDHDGKSNRTEFLAFTHPRGFHARYLAEGAINAFFNVRLALFNPADTTGHFLVRYLSSDGQDQAFGATLGARQRTTYSGPVIAQHLSTPDFSTVVESDHPFVLDRTMSWGAGGYGSHAETGLSSPAPTWYLAEGSTSGDFALFYLIQNPNETAVTATVRYLRPFGQEPIERTYGLPAHSRTTIPVDDQGPELASTDVSAVVTATAPIIVERAMYFSRPEQAFAAGHGSAGVTAPATEWFLAEGATGPFFDLFVLLANPMAQEAQVRLDYLLSDGRTFTKTHVVPANGRFTVWVDDQQIPEGSGIRPLEGVSVSTTVTSTNNVPIIAERTMWWPGPSLSATFWTEAHNSPGATATGSRWALAEGEVGGPDAAETYVLIANTSAFSGEARVTLYFEDGATTARTFTLPPRSRTSVGISSEFPVAAGRRFATLVESLGSTPAQIVVERAMYTSPDGIFWAAGTNAVATRLP